MQEAYSQPQGSIQAPMSCFNGRQNVLEACTTAHDGMLRQRAWTRTSHLESLRLCMVMSGELCLLVLTGEGVWFYLHVSGP